MAPLESSGLLQARPSVKGRKGGPAFRGPQKTSWLQGSRELLGRAEPHLLLPGPSQVSMEGGTHSPPGSPRPLLPPSCSNLLRIQLGRPPNIKDVLYDEAGNITAVPRLDLARLPKHWVKPSVEIVDPDVESLRQEALKTVSGRCKQQHRPKVPRAGADTLARARPVGVGDGLARASGKRLPDQAAHPPPPPGRSLEPTSLLFVTPTVLAESMVLAPGVTMKRAGITRRGLSAATPPAEEGERVHKELKPMSSRVPFRPTVAVEKVAHEPRALPRRPPGALLQPSSLQLSH